MQAVTAKGVTPASNSPSDISTAIENLNISVNTKTSIYILIDDSANSIIAIGNEYMYFIRSSRSNKDLFLLYDITNDTFINRNIGSELCVNSDEWLAKLNLVKGLFTRVDQYNMTVGGFHTSTDCRYLDYYRVYKSSNTWYTTSGTIEESTMNKNRIEVETSVDASYKSTGRLYTSNYNLNYGSGTTSLVYNTSGYLIIVCHLY